MYLQVIMYKYKMVYVCVMILVLYIGPLTLLQ